MFVMQVMLQPRCLLLMRGAACSTHLHSIKSQAADVISSSCGNLDAAHVHVGEIVPREERRLSLVFVHKKGACWLC